MICMQTAIHPRSYGQFNMHSRTLSPYFPFLSAISFCLLTYLTKLMDNNKIDTRLFIVVLSSVLSPETRHNSN